jgi:transcriptional regulator with XRE-family HTH domain
MGTAMVRRAEEELDPRPVGRRLRLTREVLRLTQREFAGPAGIATNTYGQYETGTRLISPRRAIDLCDLHSLTLDWIYRGDPGNLPFKLATAIKALADINPE